MWKEARNMESRVLNFEFKMVSLGNVVFIDRRIMGVTFLISLTQKFFISVRTGEFSLSLYPDNLVVHYVKFIVYSHRWP